MTDKELFERISRSPGQRAGYKQLVRELGLGGGRERRLLLEQLDRLTAAGQLVKIDRDIWAVPRRTEQGSAAARKRNHWISGRLDLHRDGYGFVRPDTREKTGEEDIFIPPDSMESAMQGDLVLVEPMPAKGMAGGQGAFCGCWNGAILRWWAFSTTPTEGARTVVIVWRGIL